MREVSRFGVALVLVNLACQGPGPAEVGKSQPRLAIAPRVVEIGSIDATSGRAHEAKVRISNRGTAVLRLSSVQASCGCTVVELPTHAIEPGREIDLKLRVTPRNASGPQSSAVVLWTNDPATPKARIDVTWVERQPISVEPNQVDLGWIGLGKVGQAEAKVLCGASVDPGSLRIASSDPRLKAVLVALDNAAPSNGPRRLAIAVEPSAGLEDAGSAEVHISKGDGPVLVRLPITWKCGPPIEVSPSSFFRSGVRMGAKVEFRLLVGAAGGGEAKVRSIAIDGEPATFTAALVASSDSPYSLLRFDVRAGHSPGIEEHKAKILFEESMLENVMISVTLVVE